MEAFAVALPIIVVELVIVAIASFAQRRQTPVSAAWSAATARRQRAEQLRQAANARMRIAYRNLQIALLQLDHAPDFRRAAGYAKQASQVPLLLRHQQFQRFRSQMLSALSRKLRSNVSVAEATAGLHELIAALGVAPFETEYLISESQRGIPTAGYVDQVRQSQAEHQRRTVALRSVRDLDPEIREQLLELEHERFRNELLGGPGAVQSGVQELD